MSYSTIEKELRKLPKSYLSEISQFIIYLKLKKHFSDFEEGNSYENALAAWRSDSADLFVNSKDSAFMQSAFENCRSTQAYTAKKIWE